MLDIFRQRGLSNVIYGAIIVATIFAFVVTFRPQAQSKTGSLSEACVARVRGACIDPKDFQSAYRLLMPSRSQQVSRKLNLKRVALDGLIERELLADEAKRLGIAVTDKEVTDQLYAGYIRVSVPAADPQVAGPILQEMYQSYARAGIVPQDVAQARFYDRDTAIPVDFRDSKTKLFDMKIYERTVRNLSNRSTTEFREEQARELLAAKMRDAVREPIRVSEPEALEQYERQYSTATLGYVPVKETWAERWAADVRPSDIDGWMKDNQSAYDKKLEERQKDDEPKASHIRHILVKLPFGATDEEKSAAVAKLSWAVARIRAGEPFAEVARQVSDDPGSASKGGDVGDKTDGFVVPFRIAADALKPGEATAGAVETQFGYHYITRDDPSKAAEIQERVKRAVAHELVAKSKADESAQNVAKRIDDAMRGGRSAEDAIKEAISPFVRADKVETLKVLPAPPEALADGGSPAAPKVLPAATFDASTDADRPQVLTSNAFNRGGEPFPGLSPGATTTLAELSFSSKDGDVMDAPLRTPEGWDVVQLKQHKTATREEFDKDREAFVQQLLSSKRDEALSLYVKRLREQAKSDIKIEESYVQEARVDGGTNANEDEDEY